MSKKQTTKHRIATNKYNKSEKGRIAMRRYHTSPKGIFAIYKARAKFLDIEFSLNRKVFEDWYGKTNCNYCGDRIPTLGIDRLDSSKGYIVGNITPCCGTCNSMKNDLSPGQFVEHIKKIHDWMLV